MDVNGYKSDLTENEKVVMGIVRAAELFKRAQAAIFKNYNLSFPQYNMLRVLDCSHNGQNKITTVSKIMLSPGANMTGIAKRLEKNGFILRKGDPLDERVTLLEITPKGRKILLKIEHQKDENLAIIMNGISSEEKKMLSRYTRQLMKNGRSPDGIS
ncbi:MarR family transcriptional regulator [Desulfobacula sp.]|uniref:MarR family winged helix-turn-helix transcriptional regulator n=1 Tax=Desulfobacula sp. TaxID=2593537 RepID=UPI002610E17C|nr:MarR family transcriptional regulator [Desulfobacula sp.]